MRIWLALLATTGLTGCVRNDPGWGGGGGGGGGGTLECSADADCGSGEVCARTHECLLPSSVYTVHTTWTLLGQPANTTTCGSSPDLGIFFTAQNGANWGYDPVPCVEGKFTVDKLPTWFDQVGLGSDQTNDAFWGTIDRSTGNATIDLPY